MKSIFYCTLALLFYNFLNAQTFVSGGIFSNATWTNANSPYVVTDTTVIFPGVTLNIQPGVEVRFDDDVILDVRGFVQAIGNPTDSIEFTSNSSSPHKGSWSGIFIDNANGGRTTINYCVFRYALHALNAGISTPLSYIKHSSFYDNESGLTNGTNTVVENCHFERNNYGVGEINSNTYFTVQYCDFVSNYQGFSGTAAINSNFFCNNIAMIVYGNSNLLGSTKNCTIMYNKIGILSNTWGGIHNCIITKNDTGIVYSYATDSITQNTICNNNYYNFVNALLSNVKILDNCWCETDSASIAAEIFDGYDNFLNGLSDFGPFQNCDSTSLPSINPSCLNPTITTNHNYWQENPSKMQVFPNPLKDKSVIIIDQFSEYTSLALYDYSGRIVRTIPLNSKSIFLERNELSAGLYYLILTQKDKARGFTKIIVTD